jgi:hypothetical protein
LFQKQASPLEMLNMADVNNDSDSLSNNIGHQNSGIEKDVNNPFLARFTIIR